jgi:hypothetical protein
MPRSTLPNRRAIEFDKELELRPYEATALAATASSTAITFPGTKQMYFKNIINLAAHTGYVAGSAQWSIATEFSADNVTFKQVGNAIVLTGIVNQIEIALSGAAVEDVVPEAAFVRVTATKTGTPGNLSFGAFLAPC